MTELYARVPLWLSLDGGVRALAPCARVALYDVAAAGGTIRCGDDPAGSLDALCAGAGAYLDTMLERGVIAVDGARLVLVAPDGAASSIGAPLPDGAAPRSTDDRDVERRIAALWSKAGANTVEARAAWLDSPAGVRALEREHRDRAWALDLAGRTSGANRGRFGRRQLVGQLADTGANPTANHGANSAPSLTLSPSEKNEESRQNAAEQRGANHGANQLADTGANSANPAAPTSMDDALKELFARTLPQHLIPDGDDTIRRGVGDRIVAAGLNTPAGLDAIARALTDPSKVWPDWRAVASKKRRVSLVMLAGSPDPASGARLYSPLGELLAYARASTQRAPSDARTAPSTAPTRPKPRSREEIAEIVRRAQEAGAHGG